MKIDKLLTLLPKDGPVYITGHVHPDGDCVGATLGLYHLLKSQLNVKVILQERPDTYSYLSGLDNVITYDELETVLKWKQELSYSLIVMDSGDLTRIEPIKEIFEQASVTLNIDHHESNTRFAAYNYVDVKASSTCEMLGLMMDLDQGEDSLLTKNIAECLYTGIIYDTGVFKHSNTRKKTHQVAAMLVDTGIDSTWMVNKMYFTRSKNSVYAMKVATDELRFVSDGNLVMTLIDYSSMQEYELKKSDTESIVHFLNEIEGPFASVFFLELEPNRFKASFRAKTFMNVCNVAKVFGGGGHVKAAGCTVVGNKEEVVEKVLKELDIELQRHH